MFLMRKLITIAMALLFTAGAPCVAGLVVSYTGGAVTAGGNGFLDVLISSNATVGPPDNLDSFSAFFRLTPLGAAVADGLQFVDPQSDAQLGRTDYVFHLDSLGENTGGPQGLVSTTTNTNDSYVGGDGTQSGLGVDLDASLGSRMLFRLDLDAALANAGDQFTIQLIDDPNTVFFDASFNAHALAAASFNPFTITTGAAGAAVPEPSTGLALLAGTAGFGWWRRRKMKPHCPATAV